MQRSESTVYSTAGLPIYLTLYVWLKPRRICIKVQHFFRFFVLPRLGSSTFVAILENAEVRIDVIKFLKFCCIYLQKRSFSCISVQFKFQKYQRAYLGIQAPALLSSQARQLLFIELIRRHLCTSS